MIKRLAVGASACALAFLANPAMASGPGTVDVGANTSGTYNWTSNANTLPSPSIYDIEFVVWNLAHTSNVKMGCEDATAAGTVLAGSPSLPTVAGITGTTWGTGGNPCDGPSGIDMNVTQNGTWDVKIDSTPKPTNAATDTNLSGYIDNISARVTSKIPGVCAFDVNGTAAVTFNEVTQEMSVNETSGNLVISNVTGCLGSVGANYTADFTGVYPINSPSGAINIKP